MYRVEELRSIKHVEDLIPMAEAFFVEMSGPPLVFDPNFIRKYADAIRHDFDRISYNAWVAYKEEEAVGFLVGTASQYFFSAQVSARQELWYVRPAFRGSRIAFDLIRAFQRWGLDIGAVELYTGIVSADAETGKKVSRILTKIGFPRAGTYHRKIAG